MKITRRIPSAQMQRIVMRQQQVKVQQQLLDEAIGQAIAGIEDLPEGAKYADRIHPKRSEMEFEIPDPPEDTPAAEE